MLLQEYVVEEGDSLKSIAARFGITVYTLLGANELADPDHLLIGQKLVVLPVEGLLHTVRLGDSVVSIAETYGAEVQAVISANALGPPYVILPDQRLVVPGGRMPLPKLVVQPADPAPGQQSQAAAPQSEPAAGDASGQAAAAVQEEPIPEPPANATPVQREFIALLAPLARETQRATGIPSSVTIAVAINETYWGTSRLAREGNNYFGIKAIGRGGTAGVITFNTWEVIGGRSLTVRANFRAYASVADSVADFGYLLTAEHHYAPAMRQTDDPRAFIRAVAAAGYATDPAYTKKIIALMDRFDLYRYDRI